MSRNNNTPHPQYLLDNTAASVSYQRSSAVDDTHLDVKEPPFINDLDMSTFT